MNDSNNKEEKNGKEVYQTPEEILHYECEQALLRHHFKEPSVNDEWKKFQHSIPSNLLSVVHKKKLLTHYIISGISVAAMILGAVFLALPNHNAQGVKGSQEMKVLIASASENQQVVLEESENAASEEQTVVINNTIPHIERQGAVLSVREADYTHVNVKKIRHNIVSIPRGKVYKILLNDGTEVWLNADSRFSFPSRFSGKNRVVTLDGEAYFKVAPDEHKPFIITTDKMTTQVLGTEFNIKAYKESEAHVTLVRGSVCVRLPHKKEEVILTPGDDIVCTENGYQVRKIDTSYYSQWMEGYFYYDDVSLTDILRDLARWYNLSIEIEQEPSLINLRLHFIAERSDNIEQVIENLNTYEYFSVIKRENRLIVKWNYNAIQ
ncbi:FecR family protein [Bacteroides zoogleoformans]|uniref:FecR family protein n=1 Tax=Bacteroides zoogleoformans TaxID=28119 RepID=A0ABN5IHD2_9BACE|nr:FecR family protein [Bacteroides zoogleoformans]AVM52126.1 hypothetical protein C4H11_03435 [Bacteroides zoogleoformans]TWJ13120.1 FecR family protein [Bacteroides zoogleoformans]